MKQKNKIQLASVLLLDSLKTIGTVGVAVLLSIQIDAISQAISSGTLTSLTNCAIICFLYAVVLGLVILVTERAKANYIKKTMVNVRQDVFHGIMCKSVSDYYAKNSAEYITLLNQNLGTYEENYLKNSFAIFESCVSILAAVILLLYINPVIAIISIVAMAIPSLIPKLYGKKIGLLQGGIMKQAAEYTAKIKDSFNGYEVLKTYQSEDKAEENHRIYALSYENSKVQMSNTMAQLYGLTNMASIAVQFLIMLLSGVFAVNGFISIGNIIAVTQLTGQVISPAFQLSTKLTQHKSTKPIRDQISAFTQENAAETVVLQLPEMKHTLVLEDVSFAYDGNPIIEHFNYSFELGKKYAVIGKSGSGKSTLLKLIAGYYEDYSGKILLDGKAYARRDCAFIHQNVFLFDDTIRNNITLNGSFTDAEISYAVHAAGLNDVIKDLPNGLDSRVEENGSRFSGGEKQRIAIARALLHKKTLFLVDEATSALDDETARQVENSILALNGITCIVVTHRLDAEMQKKYDSVLTLGKTA